MTTTTKIDATAINYASLGLLGGFPRDEAKFQAAQKMMQRLLSARDSSLNIKVSEIVAVLDQLPIKGRFFLVLQGLGSSPACNELVQQLFDWCFEESETAAITASTLTTAEDEANLDEDFVMVLPDDDDSGNNTHSGRDLNPLRFHVLRLLAFTAGELGEAGVHICRDYLASSSTICRELILTSMSKNAGIDNDELEQVYLSSTVNHQASIVATCEKVSHRCDFLLQLYRKGHVPVSVVFVHPDSQLLAPVLEEKPQLKFRKWKFHAPMYLGMLQKAFQELEHDPLGRGAALRAWERRCEGATDFTPLHAAEILLLYDRYHPMQVIPGTDKYVESILIQSSAGGKLGKVPTDLLQVVEAFPVLCKDVNKQEYVNWIINQVRSCPDVDQGVGFVDPTRESFLAHALASRDVYNRLGDFVPNYLEKISSELFWRSLKETNTTKATCSIRFFRLISSIVQALSQGRKVNPARDAVQAWCDLHTRCMPPKVNPHDERYESVRADWVLWRTSYEGVVRNLTKNAAARHALAIGQSAPTRLSRATLWVGFSRIILDMEIDGYVQMYNAGFVNQYDHVQNVLKALEFVEKASSLHSSFTACEALAKRVTDIAKEHLLPVLENMDLVKDDERNTITGNILPNLMGICGNAWKSRPELLVLLARLIHSYSNKALPPETLVTNPCLDEKKQDADGRTIRTFSRANVESRRVCAESLISNNLRTIYRLLCLHCSASRSIGAAPDALGVAAMTVDEMQQEILQIFSWFPKAEWEIKLRRGEKLSSATLISSVNSVSQRLDLIRVAADPCPAIVEQEMPILIPLGKSLVSVEGMYDRHRPIFAALGLEEKVLGGQPDELQHKYLVAQNRNVAASLVRDHLETKTTGRDPTERMAGHKSLLVSSLETGLAEFALSVQYTAKRVKNEAGIYRSSVLDYLVQSAYDVVNKSFVEARDSNSPDEEKAAIESSSIVCSAYTIMFRDDTAKRDSVGKHRFLSLSKELLRFCLGPAAKRLAHTGLELHSIWVTEALRLQWIHTEVTGGEVQLRNFNWHLPAVDMKDNWVDDHAVDSLISPLLGDEVLMRRIRASVHHGGHLSTLNALKPCERVNLLQEGLTTIKREHAERNSDLPTTTVDENLSELQLVSLFPFAKHRWVEIPVLTQAIEKADPKKDFALAYRLFTLSCSFYINDLWSHVPCLVATCESLLSTMVVRAHVSTSALLQKYWLPMRKKLATVDLSSVEKEPAVSSFFLSLFGGPLRSDINAVVRKLSHRPSEDFSCSIAHTLLNLSKSSWYLPEVREAIEKSRDDILAHLLENGGNTARHASGVFNPHRGKTADDPSVSVPFASISIPSQLQLRSSALRLYAEYCLSIALSKNYSVQVRSSRITEFVGAPSTGYRDILGLLQELEEGPLLESVLLSIFRIDSSWKVLAYLLRPSVISGRSPRTTGGLLDRVAKEMYTRDVERVFSVLLLEGPREKALTPYLMKCILRALFDIDSATSARLVLNQWRKSTGIHKDVRHDLVRLAVLAIVPSLCGADDPKESNLLQVAWEIVESSCANSDLELDSSAIVLAPQWRGSSVASSTFPNAFEQQTGPTCILRLKESDTAKKEAFDEFSTKLAKARETATLGLRLNFDKLEKSESYRGAIDRYGKALLMLSEKNTSAPVRMVARCRSLVFISSSLLGLGEQSIGATIKGQLLSTMEALLAQTRSGYESDVFEQSELITVSTLVAAILMNAVERKFSGLPTEIKTKNPAEALRSVIQDSLCVRLVVDFLRGCTESLLATPLQETSRILHLTSVIRVVSDTVDRYNNLPHNGKLSGLLLGSLSGELRILKLVGSAVNAL